MRLLFLFNHGFPELPECAVLLNCKRLANEDEGKLVKQTREH